MLAAEWHSEAAMEKLLMVALLISTLAAIGAVALSSEDDALNV